MDLARLRRTDALTDVAVLVAYLRETLAPREPEYALLDYVTLREAGVLVPLFGLGGQPHLLFTVRSADLSRHRGEISFPGGGRDDADVSTQHTALRETEEELGLSRSGVTILGALPAVQAGGSNYLILPSVGWLGEGRPQLTPNPAEVAEVFEAPLAALDDPSIAHTELWTRNGQQHVVHFFDFGAYQIWGATGRILRSLLDALPQD